MKTKWLMFLLVLLPVGVGAVDLGIVSTANFIRFPVKAIDTDGIEQAADSGHVLVWHEGEATVNSASYTASWTSSGATGSEIDSVRFRSHNYYYFFDQVADIDNDEGNGPYSGIVTMFTGGNDFQNPFSFTLAGDEWADYLASFSTHAPTAIVSAGAITTSSGAVTTVTNTGTVTGNVDGSTGSVSGAVTVGTINTDVITATALAASASAEIAAACADLDTTGHKTTGTFGELWTYSDSLNTLITLTELTAGVYNADTTGSWASGTFGELFRHIFHYATDTSFVQAGFAGRTLNTWSIPQASSQTDRDTLFWGIIGNKADTLGGVIYIHDGGSTAWEDADSTRSFIGEPI